MEVVGKLTRHDLRNKLTGIRGYTYLLNKKIGEDPEIKGYLEKIEFSIDSTEHLLDLSKIYESIGIAQLELINVGPALTSLLTSFRSYKKITVANKCRGLEVMADLQLDQLFYNLIDNSIKHGQKISEYVCVTRRNPMA